MVYYPSKNVLVSVGGWSMTYQPWTTTAEVYCFYLKSESKGSIDLSKNPKKKYREWQELKHAMLPNTIGTHTTILYDERYLMVFG